MSGNGSAPLQQLVERLLALTPHVVADPRTGGVLLWADARGLPARSVARSVLRAARRAGVHEPSVGVSRIAIAAEVAARVGAARPEPARPEVVRAGPATPAGEAPLTTVRPGDERHFLASHPLALLVADGLLAGPSAALATPSATATLAAAASARRTGSLLAALADVGIERCGELAGLTREAVEVRFGADGSALWRLARGDDPRPVFRSSPRGLPSASLEWLEFELRDPERLIFVANRLAARICTDLQGRGETARAMTLTFALAGGGTVTRQVRGARPTADRATWLRLVRAAFERIELPDAVRALTLCVDAAQPSEAPQGDLFDAGFQTGAAGEAAVARLLDDGLGSAVRFTATAHTLPERRATWQPLNADAVARTFRAPMLLVPTRRVAEPVAPPVVSPTVRPPTAPREAGRLTVITPRPSMAAASAVAEAPTEPALVRAPHPQAAPRGPTLVPPDAARVAALAAAPQLSGEALALRLLPEPRSIAVTTRQRRGAAVPVRYRERLGQGIRARRGMPLLDVLTAAGPDRVVVGHETGVPVAREYWQCLTSDGQLVLIFHDLVASPHDATDDADGVWYLHGWWD